MGKCAGYLWSKMKFKKAGKEVIDNVFGDLESMFYLMARGISSFSWKASKSLKRFLWNLLTLFFRIVLLYPLTMIWSVLVVLPSVYLLLIVRMNKVETKSKAMEARAEIIEKESAWKRFKRFLSQLFRAFFMASFLIALPLFITLWVIPRNNYSNFSSLGSIGGYLFAILCLQGMGTYRALVSFMQRKKEKERKVIKESEEFYWNIGTIITVSLVLYETFQFAVFASYAIVPSTTSSSSEETTPSPLSVSEESNGFKKWVIKVCYISIDWMEGNQMEFNAFIGIFCVGIVLFVFSILFTREVHTYGILKYRKKETKKARDFYFHSFVGTIIYGHGKLKTVNSKISMVIRLLCDSLFLAVCDKLIMTLSCDSQGFLRIQPSIECWKKEGGHLFYGTISLILCAFYIPFSVMVAPIFVEFNEETEEEIEEKEKEKEKKSFFTFGSTVKFIKPYLSMITLAKCFMLISANYVSGGGAIGTVISQLIVCVSLFLATVLWSNRNLHENLTLSKLKKSQLIADWQSVKQPAFPYSISVVKSIAFLAGIVGCIIELLYFWEIIPRKFNTSFFGEIQDTDLLLVCFLLLLAAIVSTIWFSRLKKKHSFETPKHLSKKQPMAYGKLEDEIIVETTQIEEEKEDGGERRRLGILSLPYYSIPFLILGYGDEFGEK